MEEKKSILILSGPIGAGKTTVARELIALYPGPAAYIEGDTFWSFIAKGAASNNRKKIFKMIMKSMMAAAIPYALDGFDVILDFSIPPWFLETARKIASYREIVLDFVVIQPTENYVRSGRQAGLKEGLRTTPLTTIFTRLLNNPKMPFTMTMEILRQLQRRFELVLKQAFLEYETARR